MSDKATNTKLMDTEPGGENTQYEGAKVFADQAPSSSSTSTSDTKNPNHFNTSIKGEENEAAKREREGKQERGEKTAANIRYGGAISEHGFGGETVGNSGSVGEGVREKGGEAKARKVAGYEGGSGVGG